MELIEGFNVLDIVIIGGVFLSGIFAMMRGFVRETISLLAWIVAILGVFRLTPLFTDDVSHYVVLALNYEMPNWLAITFTAILIFCGILIFFSILNIYLLRGMEKAGLGFVDHFFGFFFGVARGFVIFAGVYFLITLALTPSQQPDWLRESRLKPTLDLTIDWIVPLVRENFFSPSSLGLNEMMNDDMLSPSENKP